MTSFELSSLPLDGCRLIEAAAGTGKTYSIEGIFLRLILDGDMTVDQILVLTFTVAATEELRRRIRERLAALRSALAAPATEPGDPLVAALAAGVGRPEKALKSVEAALLDFDRAPIHTIHGFCQRLLTEHAFETGSLFDLELAVDPSPLVFETAADFWRRRMHRAPPELAAFFFEHQLTGPAALAALFGRLRQPSELSVAGEVRAPRRLKRLEAFRSAYRRLRHRWPGAKNAAAAALMDPSLKVRPYGSLDAAAAGTGDSQRAAKVRALCRAMDLYLDPAGIGFPLFEGFFLWTAEGVKKATRKGAAPPDHPFFQECQALAEADAALRTECKTALLGFKTEFVKGAQERLAVQKARENVVFYDDLLMRTRDALRAGRGLGRAAANRYRAALVDEFQDTDPVQYEIITRLFRRNDGVLFMIGDPKQAIYGFRGADVFSYLSAAGDADARYSLLQNWRSAPALVEAVNVLFSNAPRPFLLSGIDFSPSRPALGEAGGRGEAGLRIWQVAGRSNGRPLAKAEASAMLVREVADAIGRLLSGGRPASEIAVLVRTNRQAREIKSTLAGRNIPAVLFSAGSVFESEEAEQFHRLLSGICEPENAGRLRAAMATDLVGISAAELGGQEPDPEWWSRRAAPFAEDRRIWEQRGFVRMFQGLLQREQIRRRLLGLPDGERRLTNVLHLAELCHRAATEERLGPAALVKWLARRRETAQSGGDEEQLRLESDALAVQVITVHKSKGLEFPVVFVPFAWESNVLRPAGERIYHDPDAGNRPTLDLGGGDPQKSTVLSRTETLAEELRLLYVALTRAKHRCYLAWGRINQAETAPLTYLLHGKKTEGAADPAGALSAAVKTLSEEEYFAPLRRLAEKETGSISVRTVAPVPPPAVSAGKRSQTAPLLRCRQFSTTIERTWRVASYSFLSAGHRGAEGGEMPDRDRIGGDGRRPGEEAAAARPDILDFPGGARAGNFFHELLEKAPFSPDAAGTRRNLAARLLQRHRYEEKWLDGVCRGIERVIATPLVEDDPELVLSSVPKERRLHEVAFFFPLKPLDSATLEAVLPRPPSPGPRFSFSPVEGYLKGYIDLVFSHGGRYFLVDWKSNRLGGQRSDYDRSVLSRVMTDTRYDLQYLLYTLALDLYLRNRDPSYRYESDFGGVFYLFLRGMRPEQGARRGVFFDRPERRVVARLRDALFAGSVTEGV